ncbi:MAG: pantetheine-phosphate adenylyltransferase [Clostridiales bacterium]|nr:pantetheine-phosphate adenylyltransferase [Clostridiales bacterium]
MERKALYAGSFDPVTNGHLNIIERAAKMYDSLTVAIVINPNKTGFFTVEERAEIAREVTKHIPNVRVDTFSGLLADYVNENGFIASVRGLRATTDFENELQMAQMNAKLFTGATETVFLMTEPEYSFISSSLIKEVASLGGCVDDLVPPYVVSRIMEKLDK